MRVPVELHVAKKYLLAKRKQTFISIISFISVGGVAVGVMALIIVLAVMSGFERELKDRILGATAHVHVTSLDGSIANPFAGRGDRAEGRRRRRRLALHLQPDDDLLGERLGRRRASRGGHRHDRRRHPARPRPPVRAARGPPPAGRRARFRASSSARSSRGTSRSGGATSSRSSSRAGRSPRWGPSRRPPGSGWRGSPNPACTNTTRRSPTSPSRRRAAFWGCRGGPPGSR